MNHLYQRLGSVASLRLLIKFEGQTFFLFRLLRANGFRNYGWWRLKRGNRYKVSQLILAD